MKINNLWPKIMYLLQKTNFAWILGGDKEVPLYSPNAKEDTVA